MLSMLLAQLIMAYKYNHELLAPYLALDQGDKIQAEYVWIDGDNNLRSKTTTLNKKAHGYWPTPHLGL